LHFLVDDSPARTKLINKSHNNEREYLLFYQLLYFPFFRAPLCLAQNSATAEAAQPAGRGRSLSLFIRSVTLLEFSLAEMRPRPVDPQA
jgi:hypothetical protein